MRELLHETLIVGELERIFRGLLVRDRHNNVLRGALAAARILLHSCQGETPATLQDTLAEREPEPTNVRTRPACIRGR
jgi:hypothetical protein